MTLRDSGSKRVLAFLVFAAAWSGSTYAEAASIILDILGIGGLGYKDSSAALVRNGRVIAAVAEERLTRVKHQGGFPVRGVAACLRLAGASASDVGHVAVANNPWLALREKVLGWYGESFFESPEFRSYHIFHDEMHATLRYLETMERHRTERDGRFHVVPHHLCHMASSFLVSPWDRAAVIDMDGRGEVSTSALGVGSGAAIEVFRVDHMPNSLGLLHAAVSDYLGFSGADDEFRVMSISSQGEPTFLGKFREIVRPPKSREEQRRRKPAATMRSNA